MHAYELRFPSRISALRIIACLCLGWLLLTDATAVPDETRTQLVGVVGNDFDELHSLFQLRKVADCNCAGAVFSCTDIKILSSALVGDQGRMSQGARPCVGLGCPPARVSLYLLQRLVAGGGGGIHHLFLQDVKKN